MRHRSDSGIEIVLALHQRKARLHAKMVAQAEALRLLVGLGPRVLDRGPLVEERVRLWIALPLAEAVEAARRFASLGYTERVDALLPIDAPELPFPSSGVIRWNRQPLKRLELVREDPRVIRESAPDQRTFLLELSDGAVRPIRGYRGSPGALEKRGLSTTDARVLTNLVFRPALGRFLDPFAGTGGIALAARASGWTVTTADIDPRLRFGLQKISGDHIVADARKLPLDSSSVDAIATEPPFDVSQGEMLLDALAEMSRILRPQRLLSILAPQWQIALLAQRAYLLPFHQLLQEPVDRRGDEMEILVLERR